MSESRQQVAQSKLQQKGIQCSQDSFVEHVGNGDEYTVRLFIDAGIDINGQNSKGITALMKAARIGLPPMVFLLANCNADLNKKGQANWTPLMTAVQGQDNQQHRIEIVRFLVGVHEIKKPKIIARVNDRNNNRETALTIAERFGASQELIDVLKAAGATH